MNNSGILIIIYISVSVYICSQISANELSEASEVSMAKGIYFFNEKKHMQALEQFNIVYKENPSNHEILNMIGLTLNELQKYEKSKAFMLKAINNAPDKFKAEYQFNLGFLFYKNKKYKEAEEYFRLSTKSKYKKGDSYYYIALIKDEQNSADEKLEYFKKAYCFLYNKKLKQHTMDLIKSMGDNIPNCNLIYDTAFSLQAYSGIIYDSNITLNPKNGTSTASNVGSTAIPFSIIAGYKSKQKVSLSAKGMLNGNIYTKKQVRDYQTLGTGVSLGININGEENRNYELIYLFDYSWLHYNTNFVPYILGNTIFLNYSKYYRQSKVTVSVPLGYDSYKLNTSSSADNKTGFNTGITTAYRIKPGKWGIIGLLSNITWKNALGTNQKFYSGKAGLNYQSPVFLSRFISSFSYEFILTNYAKASPVRNDKENNISTGISSLLYTFLQLGIDYSYTGVSSNYTAYSYNKHVIGFKIYYAY